MNHQETLENYISCLTDIKKRTEVIRRILNNIVLEDDVVTVEILALQFRKVFELIALTGIVANREKYAEINKDFHKNYHARNIIKSLKEINPDFFPVPVRGEKTGTYNNGQHSNYVMEKLGKGALTENQLTNYWDRCGSLLHATNPYGEPKKIKQTLKVMPDWLGGIVKLLNSHNSMGINGEYMIAATMQSEKTGAVHAAFFEKLVGSTVLDSGEIIGNKKPPEGGFKFDASYVHPVPFKKCKPF
tara:strand:+ start:134 stop:868 length:735 start_codon:yes stop_codon:yes gene_type:complete